MKKILVGVYGNNGHQIHNVMAQHPLGELAAVAAFPRSALPKDLAPAVYPSLDGLLQDPRVQLISLCSPRRADQAWDAIRCMEAGKHVYAEKPSALTESDLDAIIATARKTGMQYHEMGGVFLAQPYREMHRLIKSGAIGTVVQVLSQKCYPWGDWRPADERLDGGLGLQVGVYATRFVEHVAGVRIASLDMVETKLGNPIADSNCRIAVSMIMRLANGGVASAVCNYLNPIQSRCWGYEILRVFGTLGIVESNADGNTARLLLTGQPPQDLDLSSVTEDYLTLYLRALAGGPPMPMGLEEELSPTRWVIRAKSRIKQD